MKISEETLIQIDNLKKEFEWVDRLYIGKYGEIKLKKGEDDRLLSMKH